MAWNKRLVPWDKYPRRVRGDEGCPEMPCRICGQNIDAGDPYKDGGAGRRAHELCAHNEMVSRKV